MDIDIGHLPVPKYNRKKPFFPTKEESEKVKTVKHINNLFDKKFITKYFTFQNKKIAAPVEIRNLYKPIAVKKTA